MKCILVFDHLNDILFSKCDKKFLKHVHKLGRSQGMESKDIVDGELDINFLIQLFSPVVTSQRVMSSQFGNSYRSIQCQDGTNMVFDEYMGYLFMCMGFEEINWLRRMLGISVSIIQHLCGPDISVLKEENGRREVVCRLIDTWNSLVATDQSVLIEAVEELTTNPELSGATISALRQATDSLKSVLDVGKSHALVFVRNKFLALYSSKSAEELSSGDLIFLSLLAESQARRGTSPNPNQLQADKPFRSFTSDQSSDEEFFSPEASPKIIGNAKPSDVAPVLDEEKEQIISEVVLLSHGHLSAVVPHAVHMSAIIPGVYLVILYQRCTENLAVGLHDSIESAVDLLESDVTDLELVKRSMDRLDSGIKKFFDNLKKLKSNEVTPQIDANWKVVRSKWDVVKKQWKGEGQPIGLQGLVTYLKEFLHSPLFIELYSVTRQRPQISGICGNVTNALSSYHTLLKPSSSNLNNSSRASLSINKYLEEFPALVHFIYIDRTNDRITAPTIDFDCPKTVEVTQRKIWSMVEFSRCHLQEGHTSLMWKDLTFNYAYFIWFEDSSGASLKPKVSPTVVTKNLQIPGVISGNFYKQLMEGCFPKMGSKVRCYELYCVHLGHVTSPLVLDHCRRLAATVWEVRGTPTDPLDLF